MEIKIIAASWSKWDRFIKRWGVSFLIDNDILFDTFGKPSHFCKQIKCLGVDISKIQHIVLSHKDWDHISGLCPLLDLQGTVNRDKINMYICPDFCEEFKEKIRGYGVNLTEPKGVFEVKKNIFAVNGLTGTTDNEIIYEQFLVLKSKEGLVIITGCAHPGIENIVKWTRNCFNSNIYMVMGGFHLKDKNKQDILEIAKKLKVIGVKKIAPTHCTGRYAMNIFKREFGNNFIDLRRHIFIQTNSY